MFEQIKIPSFVLSGVAFATNTGTFRKDSLHTRHKTSRPNTKKHDLDKRREVNKTERTVEEKREDACAQIETGYTNPDIFPPRRAHPFVFYKLRLSIPPKSDILHPLELLPDDAPSTQGWISMEYDENNCLSKGEENNPPLDAFDEIVPESDECAQQAVQQLTEASKMTDSSTLNRAEIRAYSRRYDLKPRFRWEHCRLVQYDRY